jgi:hypothetical protein
MPYTQNVEQHHKLMYADNVRMVAQQMKNPLIGAVTVVPGSGLAMRVADLIQKKRAMRGESRSRRNPENPTTATSRWIVMPDQPIQSGQYIDREDKWKMAQDPTSAFMRADVSAVTRAYADMVMGIEELSDGVFGITGGGILGTARDGLSGGQHGAGAATVLPPAQTVVHAAVGLTLTKLRQARKTLKKADFGIDGQMDPLYGAITPEQEDDLLGIAAASGANLNTFEIEQLKSGTPTKLLGITWIVTNRLPKTGLIRTCAIWSKANIIVGEWDPINGRMWNDTSAQEKPYMLTEFTADAVRAEDKGVIAIECQEP